MVLRGSCIGMQKTAYLPGRDVYEYPYTPETFSLVLRQKTVDKVLGYDGR